METSNLVLNSDGTVLLGVPKNSVSVIIPDGVKEIFNDALHNCTFLKEITMSNTVTKIGAHAFMGCSSLTNVKLSENIKYIGCCAFRGCSSLVHIELPKAINEIGDLAFYGCTSLKKVVFPPTLAVIGKAAFYGCTSLEMVKLNANIKEILFRAFNVCPSLKTIHCGIKNMMKTMIDPKAFDTYAFHLCKLVVMNLKQCEKHEIFGKFEHVELDNLIKNTTGSPVLVLPDPS